MSVIAVVPARLNSTGIPRKNWRPLAGGLSCVARAVQCGRDAGVDEVWVNCTIEAWREYGQNLNAKYWPRPLALDAVDTPMIDVIQEMLRGGCFENQDDVILILQPTQPFRTPQHVQQAIQLLKETGADSVVSVVELPKTHHIEAQVTIGEGNVLWRALSEYTNEGYWLKYLPSRRQEMEPLYIRDGTCYAFKRSIVEAYGNIYGVVARPLIIPPEESCSLDSESDWQAVEKRWNERAAQRS